MSSQNRQVLLEKYILRVWCVDIISFVIGNEQDLMSCTKLELISDNDLNQDVSCYNLLTQQWSDTCHSLNLSNSLLFQVILSI